MQCNTCKREMVQLFLTQACDHCDYGVPLEKCHRGFIVLRLSCDYTLGFDDYVFRTRLDAEHWRRVAGRDADPIVAVYSLNPFKWHLSRGTLKDVVLADCQQTVFRDHKFAAKSNAVWLADPQKAGS